MKTSANGRARPNGDWALLGTILYDIIKIKLQVQYISNSKLFVQNITNSTLFVLDN